MYLLEIFYYTNVQVQDIQEDAEILFEMKVKVANSKIIAPVIHKTYGIVKKLAML